MPGEAEPTGGLLAVHAHPDDESLATGALLATWAAAGRPVTVVTCTRGERGEVIGDDLAPLAGDGPALAAHRTGELEAALAALGVSAPVFLDTVSLADHPDECYGDSGMAWLSDGRAGAAGRPPAGSFTASDPRVAAERLATVLRRRRPDVVVGYEPGGGYGHPDHVRAHEVMMAAVRRAVDGGGEPGWAVPQVLWSVLDGGRLRAGYRACRDRAEASGLLAPDPDGPLPSAAVSGDLVDLRVDVAPVRAAVLAALRAHRSQVQAVQGHDGPVVASYALSNRVVLPVLEQETYRVVVADRPVSWPTGARLAWGA